MKDVRVSAGDVSGREIEARSERGAGIVAEMEGSCCELFKLLILLILLMEAGGDRLPSWNPEPGRIGGVGGKKILGADCSQEVSDRCRSGLHISFLFLKGIIFSRNLLAGGKRVSAPSKRLEMEGSEHFRESSAGGDKGN